MLLLTATVRPSAEVGRLVVSDPRERLAEYLTGFRAALALAPSSFDGVVLAENSGADLTPFQSLAGSRTDVEVLHVPAHTAGRGAGRGFHETLLVADAFQRSVLLRRPETTAWKVTGRYQVPNLPQVVRGGPHGFDLVLSLRRYPRIWSEMRVYSTTAQGIAMLVEHVDALREDRAGEAPEDALAPEPALYDLILRLRGQGASVAPRLAVEPYVVGRRGYNGLSYESRAQWGIWALRVTGRRLVPALWL